MLRFACKDVVTEPPTTIIIVNDGDTAESSPLHGESVYFLPESAIEPTAGWQSREGKPSMTICAMHSFGKCFGRIHGEPSTCFQIHIKSDVLQALRAQYTLPARRFFTRKVYTDFPPALRDHVSALLRKPLKLQHLEYRVSDVAVTTGLLRSESAHRQWLFDESNTSDSSSLGLSTLCEHFALRGWCPNRENCTGIHVALASAQVHDQALLALFKEISAAAALQAAAFDMSNDPSQGSKFIDTTSSTTQGVSGRISGMSPVSAATLN